MSARSIFAAFALSTVAAGLASCRPETVSCFLDYECDLGDGKGRCEWTGHCAQPDASCEGVGRRYGKNAGDLAGRCVEPMEAGSSDDAADGDDDGTDGPADGGDVDTGSNQPPPCVGQFYDDFEDNALHPSWRVYATEPSNSSWVVETGGTLQISIPAGGNGAAGLQTLDSLPIADGRVQIEVVSPPPSSSGIGIAVGSADLSTGLLLLVSQFSASFVAIPDPNTADFLDDGFPIDLDVTPFIDVELRTGEGSGTATLRVSGDGETFTTLGTVGHQIPLDVATVGIYAANLVVGGEPIGATVRFGSARICY